MNKNNKQTNKTTIWAQLVCRLDVIRGALITVLLVKQTKTPKTLPCSVMYSLTHDTQISQICKVG